MRTPLIHHLVIIEYIALGLIHDQLNQQNELFFFVVPAEFICLRRLVDVFELGLHEDTSVVVGEIGDGGKIGDVGEIDDGGGLGVSIGGKNSRVLSDGDSSDINGV